jgi:DNA gyrase subunit A
MHVDSLRVMGRAAQGVRLINLKGTASIAAVARAPRSEDEDELDEEALAEIDPNAPIEVLNDDLTEDISEEEDTTEEESEEE